MPSLLMDTWHHLFRGCRFLDDSNISYRIRWILGCSSTCNVTSPVHGQSLIDGFGITIFLQWIMNSGVTLYCKNGLNTNLISFHRLKYKDATFIKESLCGLFIHGRDHAITHGHAFCQRLAWETYKATFGDTNVYEQLPMQPSQAEAFLRSTTSRLFLRRYKWGVNLRTSSLPIAYNPSQTEEGFQSSSSHHLICSCFCMPSFFRAAAIALDLILRCVCPRFVWS